jgi:hypothetical protein
MLVSLKPFATPRLLYSAANTIGRFIQSRLNASRRKLQLYSLLLPPR